MDVAHTQIEPWRLPRLNLASSNNPQQLFSNHHHRQPLPPPTIIHNRHSRHQLQRKRGGNATSLIDNNQVHHITTIANLCHHPPLLLSPPTTIHNGHSRHQPQRKRGGNAMSPPVAQQTMERAGDNVAMCHVIQTVMMDAIVTICSMQDSYHIPFPFFCSHRMQEPRCPQRHGNNTTST